MRQSTKRTDMNWLRLEKRLRNALRLFARLGTTEQLMRETITRIDEIIANETKRGNELPPGWCGEAYEGIASLEWMNPDDELGIDKL